MATTSLPASATTASAPITNFPYVLTAVSAVSPTDAWAVGNFNDVSNSVYRGHVLHWNGSHWTESTLPKICCNIYSSNLAAVSASSATNAWAVGAYLTTTGLSRLLILHWNGIHWTQLPGPLAPATDVITVGGVSADSATDAWLVGVVYDNTTMGQDPLTLHWNGQRWTKVSNPHPSGANSFSYLNAVTTFPSHAAWAVGQDQTTTNDSPMAFRWDGGKWTRTPTPQPSFSSFAGVAGASSSDVWAVGYYLVTNAAIVTTTLGVTEHWDGTQWKQVASPNPGGTSTQQLAHATYLNAVSAVGPHDVWAVGSYSSGPQQALILHWNGTKWTQAAPGVTANNPFLNGVSALSQSDAWAVGAVGTFGSATSLILHWNGTNWTRS